LQLGALIVDIDSITLSDEECDYLTHPLVGGVILFARNYSTVSGLVTLIKKIKGLRQPSLLVFVDQEGGRVQRFKKNFTKLPSLWALGGLYEQNPEKISSLVTLCGWMMSIELKAVGVDVSFAPVLDLFSSESKVIGDRAFHSDPEITCHLARLYISAMNGCGMHAVGKHFPGHGSVAADSHIELPIDERSLEEIEKKDLIPFKLMISAGLSGLMAAHISFPNVDALAASGFSEIWLKKILRRKLGFHGVIFSDDLSMEGAAVFSSYFERANLALSAGCDVLVVCNNKTGIAEILDNYTHLPISSEAKSLELLRGPSHEIPYKVLRSTSSWRQAERYILDFVAQGV